MMTFDTFESARLDTAAVDLSQKMASLRSGIESSLKPKYDVYVNTSESVGDNIRRWIGTDTSDKAVDLSAVKATAMDTAKRVYSGIELPDGTQSLGLQEIHDWKVNPEYYTQNMKQHAGYAAEVIGTAKENMQAKIDGTGITSYRADDCPDLFQKNDQYVDKIRVDADGNIVDRVQVKFVGKDAGECLSKLMSKKFDKYFTDGMVDKLEVPKDYYDDMMKLIPDKIDELQEQLDHVQSEGKVDAAKGIENRINKYKQLQDMLEQSTVSSDEAVEAVKHPKRYVTKLFVEDTFAQSHQAGLDSAAVAATITVAVSTVDNVSKVMEGEITAQEAFVDVAKDTAIAGGIAYGTTFVSTAVAQTMSASSHQLIHSLGSSGVPAAVISFGVESFDSVVDYADGVIDGKQLAYELGENAAQVAGSAAGAAVTGAIVGSVVPGAGTVVGFAAGMVGGMVGCAVASEAYVSAVEFGAEHADVMAEKAQEMANKTVDIAKEVIPDKVPDIANAINDYAAANGLPFSI